jgi:cellulose synthase/poly-beta-1,6-N-acetylglucosamine synthase-like glycosyltransferase/peptidoglycan/xylan/chitin deacetylase (PgdA/CDA1 family)
MPETAHANFVAFLNLLARKLHVEGRKVILVQQPVEVTSRTRELAKAVDYVLLGTYVGFDERRAGPLAGQAWFERVLENQFAGLDRNKLIVGLGSYGFDWDGLGRKRQLAVQAAWDLLRQSSAPLTFDLRALNPHFSFKEPSGLRHDVWYLDGVSVHNQARSALSLQPAGLAVWRLGLEDPSVWASVGRGRLPDAEARKQLTLLQPGNDAYAVAKGDVIDFGGAGASGKRTITYDDKLGLAVGQSLELVPRQVQLNAIGLVDKKMVALTFDDGPDPRFTPKILDILAEKGARATFFVIGKNAVANPSLLRRIYDQGHDLGNHTYSHPDMLENASVSVELELNGTQRVLESLLGRHTIFFRPPYASRHLLQQSEAPRIVETASRLGYLTVSAAVDPYDWGGPTGPQIINRVIEQVEDETGQIVLLHDSGGDRRLTVEALPIVIDRLKARGYKFVTLHEIIGKSRAEVMPLADSTGALAVIGQTIRSAWFATVHLVVEAFPIVVIGATIFGLARLLLIMLAACVQRRRELARASLTWTPHSVAVLVPAYNEAKVICRTVEALIACSQCRNFQILVIDDGSTDGTAEAASHAFSGNERVKIYRKPNGGKAVALNFGLEQTQAEVIVAIDADTILMPGAIELLARHFSDPMVGAVAGSAVVGNQVNFITRFQALEYATSQNLDRRAFELFNAIGVVPGAIGAWRRAALLQVGGYASDTLAEDADVTVALERAGWKVIYEPRACARTEAPEAVRTFLKQRLRWMFGTLQVAHKHSGALLRGPLGTALITLPNIYLFQFAFTLLAPIVDAMLLWSMVSMVADWSVAPDLQGTEGISPIIAYWLMFQSFDIAAAALALRLDGATRSWPLLPLVVLQRFCYRQLLYFVAIRSIAAAVKGRIVGWGKLARSGRVSSPTPTQEALAGQSA